MQLLNPYPDVRADHPVLAREARRVRWLKRAGTPGRYALRIILLVLGIVLALYIGWLALEWIQAQRPFFYPWSLYRSSADFLVILVAVSLLATLPLDYVSITAALNSISGEMVAGTWDLLRLTAIREGELVLAKHATSQLRAWRTTMWVVGLRIAASLFVLIMLLTQYFSGTRPMWFVASGEDGLSFMFNFIQFAALITIFILEPVWRMRAVTALGMVISARSRDGASSALTAMGVLLALWLALAVVFAALIAGLSVLLFTVAAFGVGALCAPLLLLFVIVPTVYGFYSILKTWSLRQVARRLVATTG
jgi:hypothetical protein